MTTKRLLRERTHYSLDRTPEFAVGRSPIPSSRPANSTTLSRWHISPISCSGSYPGAPGPTICAHCCRGTGGSAATGPPRRKRSGATKGFPLAVASRMIACFEVSGKATGIVEIASMPSALSSSSRARDRRGRWKIQSEGLPAVHRSQYSQVSGGRTVSRGTEVATCSPAGMRRKTARWMHWLLRRGRCAVKLARARAQYPKKSGTARHTLLPYRPKSAQPSRW
jgi:hypothetical protein